MAIAAFGATDSDAPVFPRAAYLAHLRSYGIDAVSFHGLASRMSYWFDAPPPEGTGAWVAYADTGTAWVGAGRPIAPEEQIGRAAGRFVAAARRARRRASFFCAEERIDGFDALRIGEVAGPIAATIALGWATVRCVVRQRGSTTSMTPTARTLGYRCEAG
jgi:lysylphosphatidylglycerol synthetase-like protein (DUF2156 family)